jgi:hypothetical protein
MTVKPLQHRNRTREEPPVPAPTAERLSGVRVVSFDDDEARPSREDMTYGETIFNRAVVPLPRFLTSRKKPPRR